jgi:hypothetical protein
MLSPGGRVVHQYSKSFPRLERTTPTGRGKSGSMGKQIIILAWLFRDKEQKYAFFLDRFLKKLSHLLLGKDICTVAFVLDLTSWLHIIDINNRIGVIST